MAFIALMKLDAVVSYRSGFVQVANATATGSGVRIQANGRYETANKRILGRVTAQAADVGQLLPPSQAGIPISGPVAVSAQVTGTSDTPSVVVQVASQDLTVEGVRLDGASLSARYFKGIVTSADDGFKVTSGPALYLVPAFRYETASKAFSLTGSISGETLQRLTALARAQSGQRHRRALRAILARLPDNLAGSLSVPQIQAEGTLARPHAHIIANLDAFVYGSERLDTIRADASYGEGRVDVASLEARGKPDAYLSASGNVDPKGALSARLEASGIDLAPLNSFVALPKPLSGQIGDLTVIAQGETRAPDITASLTLDNPSYGSFSVQQTGQRPDRPGWKSDRHRRDPDRQRRKDAARWCH